MAVFCAGPVGALFLYGLRLPLSYNTAVGWGQPIWALQDVGLWFLLLWLLRLNESRWLTRATHVLAIVDLVAASLDGCTSLLDWGDPQILHIAQLGDAIFTAIITVAEFFPLVLLAFGLRKRLDPARWSVAISAFLVQMILVIRVAATQGVRFTHWTLGQKINLPLFTVLGNSFTALLLARTALLLSIIYAVYRHAIEERRRQAEIEQEVKSARELQQVLIPEALPPVSGYAVTSAYRPAQEVGGDFFLIVPIEKEGGSSALIILGDVSGKGLRAAMSVSLIVGTACTLADIYSSPSEILAGLNRRLHGRLHGGFATCLVLRLGADGRCVIANAGHCAPFLNDREIPLPGVLPLGVLPEAKYEEHMLQLHTGDHLVLYTDGLIEARTPTGELFSFDRLSRLMTRRPNAEEAMAEAQSFGQQDDITVLTMTRLAAGAESSTQFSAPSLGGVERLRATA
jgi:serine phosphatase RsbU (regulator of sigma subunit)